MVTFGTYDDYFGT